MSALHADTAIEGFSELEARLIDFLRVIPYENTHYRVYSPTLASILLDACSLIESVLKSTMDNARYNAIPDITNLRNRRYSDTPPFLTINQLRTVFRPDGLAGKRVVYLPRGDRSAPWSAWGPNRVVRPTWWNAYNAVKHDRFGNFSQARLHQTAHAMKALFLVLSLSLEYRQRLIARGIIRSRGLDTRGLLAVAQTWEPLQTPETVVAVSRIFGYKFLSTGSTGYTPDPHVFL